VQHDRNNEVTNKTYELNSAGHVHNMHPWQWPQDTAAALLEAMSPRLVLAVGARCG